MRKYLKDFKKYFEEKNIEYVHGIVGCTVGIHSGTRACGIFFIENKF